jgi:hypothetical protein
VGGEFYWNPGFRRRAPESAGGPSSLAVGAETAGACSASSETHAKAADEMCDPGETVMPGLVPGIHVLWAPSLEDVDGRDKPGHDENFELLARA